MGSFEGLLYNFQSSDGSTSIRELLYKLSQGLANKEEYELSLIVKWINSGDVIQTYYVRLEYTTENAIGLHMFNSNGVTSEKPLCELVYINCNNLQDESYEISGDYWVGALPTNRELVTVNSISSAITAINNNKKVIFNVPNNPNGIINLFDKEGIQINNVVEVKLFICEYIKNGNTITCCCPIICRGNSNVNYNGVVYVSFNSSQIVVIGTVV